mgnify:CR=1 FL=1
MDDTKKALSDGLDKALLDVLTNGQVVIDPATGNPVKVTPSAAMLNVIRGRLKDCGVTANPAAGNNPISDLMKRARETGLKLHRGDLPPLSTEPDAATG